jgi:hypothetical protein
VTDPIEDDLDDFADIAEPEPNWFQYPILSRSEMLASIQERGNLDGRAVNLFRNALQRPKKSDLLTHYVGLNLYHPGSHYIYTTPDPDRVRHKNWRPEITALAIEHRTIAPCAVFSNTLSWIDSNDLLPSERTYNAGFAVYTVESDVMPLSDQLRIVYSGLLKSIDAEFRRYRDYRGYEVVYSAGKSVHYHFCFDLRHLKHDLAVAGNSSYRDNWTRDLPDSLLRPAYAERWDRLAAMFREISDLEPDSRLRFWEQLRRCPWADRLVKGAHPLGLPRGYRIPQPVLASGIFQNSKRKATEWFHDADKLGELCRPEYVRRRKRAFIELEIAVTAREEELFRKHALTIFRQIIGNEYPKFAGFEVNEAGFRCRFYNGPNDNNPSSFCEGNRSRILLQGQHSFDSDGIPLGTTPNQIFDWIVSQHAAGPRRQCMTGLRWPGSSMTTSSK